MQRKSRSDILKINFRPELIFTASRSSGPGGQHVNKVSTKVELRFNILQSRILNEEQKQILLIKLKRKLTSEGELIIISQESRSQIKNRENALEKFYLLIQKVFKPAIKRISTRPTMGSKEKRLEQKKKLSVKKETRKPPTKEN
jgi:ribosome-associated protein